MTNTKTIDKMIPFDIIVHFCTIFKILLAAEHTNSFN